MALLLTIGMILLWGLWALFEKIALFSATPSQTFFVFYTWSAFLFLPITIILLRVQMGWEGFRIARPVWAWIFLAVMSDFMATLAIRVALIHAATGMAVSVTSIYPIFTAMLSQYFFKERIAPVQFVGIALACIGVMVVGMN